MNCPYDDNHLYSVRTERGWYYLHCPGCGNEWTLSGTQTNAPLPEGNPS